MQLINKQEIFVNDLYEYFKDKKYNCELIGLYEPDYDDLEIIFKNYANTKYQFIMYFENKIPFMPKYNNIAIETGFTKFYNKAKVFAIYQDEESYPLTLNFFYTFLFLSKTEQ